MKYLDEYRDGDVAKKIVGEMRRIQTRPWVLMEVCGGQTHSIVKNGIDHLLPEGVELVHGPGCPVCVTPLEMIDKAHAIARQKNVIFCSFGDMLRVPGSDGDLFTIKSLGGDVRVVYSPLDCLKLARANPSKQVVFFAIGFETTAPANAMLAWRAREEQVNNVSLLVSHVLVPPALETILQSPDNRVQGFLGPGHVSMVIGTAPYSFIAEHYRKPIVVAGFEPLDILQSIAMVLRQLAEERCVVENQYRRIVPESGNGPGLAAISRVFELREFFEWRGLGSIDHSGVRVRATYARYDAERKFALPGLKIADPKACQCGEVLTGVIKPWQCKVFGGACTPETPLGALMVSSEGACAAYYNYGARVAERRRAAQPEAAE